MFDFNALNEITNKLKTHIKNNIQHLYSDNPRIYELWFTDMSVLKMTDFVICISVNTEIKQRIIENQYSHLIHDAVSQIYNLDLKVIVYNTQDGKITKEQMDADERRLFLDDINDINSIKADKYINITDEKNGINDVNGTNEKGEISNIFAPTSPLLPRDFDEVKDGGRENEISEFIIANNGANFNTSQRDSRDIKRNFRLDYTFDNFVVGSSNRLAYKACTIVAQYPATKYNPFFIHGPSGLGKTHLLYAIANEYAQRFRNARILYTTGEEFTNQLINYLAVSDRNQKQQYLQYFREKYRNCDMLLIDDIQFISGKDTTQEEFFHTFNALYGAGKQIILTSDRPPKDIKILEDRLTSRFESGLIADIQPPDLELRIAILKRKAEDMGIKISNEVLFFLAENISSNIRQIEGAIKKLNAYSYLNNSGITLDLAKGCITDILSGTEPINVTVEKVLNLISQTYGVPQEELKGRKRTKEIAFARNVAIYIIRKITDLSLPATGRFFDRDHSTIYSAVASIESEIKTNSALNNQIEEISKLAKG